MYVMHLRIVRTRHVSGETHGKWVGIFIINFYEIFEKEQKSSQKTSTFADAVKRIS